MNTMQSYLKQLSKYPVLKEELVRELIAKAQKGSVKARNKVITHNLRLVVNVMKRYFSWNEQENMDFLMAGNFGLFRAIKNFDLNKKFKFSTYATIWIRQHISRYIYNNLKTVRTPVHVQEKINKIKKKVDKGLELTKREKYYLNNCDISMCSFDRKLDGQDDDKYGTFNPDSAR